MTGLSLSEIRVSQITLCMLVKAGKGDAVHRDRPAHGLALNVQGTKRYAFEGGEVLNVQSGQIIYLPRGSNYTVYSVEIGDCYAINFQLTCETELAHGEPFVFTPREVAPFLSLYRDAETVWRTKPQGYMARCLSDLYGLFYRMQAQSAGYIPQSRLARLMPAVEKIRATYDGQTPPIPELAALCGMSETYFRRLFSQAFGMPPVSYIRELRLLRARELLESGQYAVHDAAELSGFCDDSYFSREYKKKYGEAPARHSCGRSSGFGQE